MNNWGPPVPSARVPFMHEVVRLEEEIQRLRTAFEAQQQHLKESSSQWDALNESLADLDMANAILGSEAMVWLMGGSNHVEAHLSALRPHVTQWWDKYGNYMRPGNIEHDFTTASDLLDENEWLKRMFRHIAGVAQSEDHEYVVRTVRFICAGVVEDVDE